MNNPYRREHRVAATTRNYGELQIIETAISIAQVLPPASFGDRGQRRHRNRVSL